MGWKQHFLKKVAFKVKIMEIKHLVFKRLKVFNHVASLGIFNKPLKEKIKTLIHSVTD